MRTQDTVNNRIIESRSQRSGHKARALRVGALRGVVGSLLALGLLGCEADVEAPIVARALERSSLTQKSAGLPCEAGDGFGQVAAEALQTVGAFIRQLGWRPRATAQ